MTDKERLDWLERKHTLHQAVEILYIVDGYQLTLTHDGQGFYSCFGSDIRSVIDHAAHTYPQ